MGQGLGQGLDQGLGQGPTCTSACTCICAFAPVFTLTGLGLCFAELHELVDESEVSDRGGKAQKGDQESMLR